MLKPLSGYADLKDPEAVKVALTRTGWSEATKEMTCGAYALYAKQHGFTFVPPHYRRVEKLPFIPLQSEVEQLIAAMRLRTSTFLSLLKDMGARPLEAWTLKWKDIDFTSSTVTVTPLKHSNPRRLKLSTRTMNQLSQLEKSAERILGDGTIRTYQHFLRNFEFARRAAAARVIRGWARLVSALYATTKPQRSIIEPKISYMS